MKEIKISASVARAMQLYIKRGLIFKGGECRHCDLSALPEEPVYDDEVHDQIFEHFTDFHPEVWKEFKKSIPSETVEYMRSKAPVGTPIKVPNPLPPNATPVNSPERKRPLPTGNPFFGSNLNFLLGDKNEELSFLPNLEESSSITKDSRRHFNEREKIALIEEDGQASNRAKIDVAGTHYEDSSANEIAQMILPLKGL